MNLGERMKKMEEDEKRADGTTEHIIFEDARKDNGRRTTTSPHPLWHPPGGWTLAGCDCDPHVEHCEICDERREIAHTVETYRDAIRAHVLGQAQLRTLDAVLDDLLDSGSSTPTDGTS